MNMRALKRWSANVAAPVLDQRTGTPSVLVVTSVASMIDNFNLPNIDLLRTTGAEVHVACNFEVGNTIPPDRVERLRAALTRRDVGLHQIDFSRRVASVHHHVQAFSQLKLLVSKLKPSLIHCHSPIGGAITRLVARRHHARVIYTAHGFHFSRGAPLLNWLTFYPLERLLSSFTDVLVTVNNEDHRRAQYMHAGEVVLSPGVGVDLARFAAAARSRKESRKRLGLTEDDICVLSVGELNRNKNHEVVVRAVATLQHPRLRYLICGRGPLEEYLTKLTVRLRVAQTVTLLGFREDVADLYSAADIFVMPSFREGLPIALVEAMASGLPCIGSQSRGVADLLTPYSPDMTLPPSDARGFAQALQDLIEDDSRRERESQVNLRVSKGYSVKAAMEIIEPVYQRQLSPP